MVSVRTWSREQLLIEQSRAARFLRYSLDEAEELEHHGLDPTEQALLEQMRRLEYLLAPWDWDA